MFGYMPVDLIDIIMGILLAMKLRTKLFWNKLKTTLRERYNIVHARMGHQLKRQWLYPSIVQKLR